ncbi:MAG: outer membrane protein assembly factor BamA [Elusimicrobiota bacterium]|jgi:outer membrane protein insertion porin family|nr:outer membrane protein assembly factor BamA [Elusimicrobiota bacterium]
MKMRKLFVAFLFLFASSIIYAQTDVISGVSIVGLKNVKQKEVISIIVSKKQHIYSEENVRDDARAVLELGYFEDIEFYFNPTNGLLTFTVIEKPYIDKIEFKGNKQVSRGKLRKASVLKIKEYYDPAKLEETKIKIAELYSDEGYTDAAIEVYPTTDEKTNKMTINFLITENKKITIGDIKFDALSAYRPRRIIKLMKNTRLNKPFKVEGFRADQKAIENFYQNSGYMDFAITGSSITYNEDRTKMTITLEISEGVKYIVGSVGADGYEALKIKEIVKNFKLKTGDVYNKERIGETLQGIYDSYSDIGYLQSAINPEFEKNAQEGLVNIIFSIRENARVYVGNIYVDGLLSTKDKVIRREVLLKSGDPLSVGKVRRSIQRIYNLGFIDGVEPKLLPTNAPNIMDVGFNVTEGRPGMVSAGAGYSSVDSFMVSLQFQYLNLFGLGQRINALTELGESRQNYQIDWTEPWIFDKNMSLTLSAYKVDRIRDYYGYSSVYDEHRMGGSVRVGPRISDYLSLSVGYSFENVRLALRDGANQNAVNQFNSATDISRDNISSLLTSIAYDTRDYVFDATTGHRQYLSLQFASDYLGGDVNFVKTRFRSSWFFPTFWKFVLSFNFNIAQVEGYSGQSVPINEYFYIGGVDTVRGYKYNTIGETAGARYMGVLNVEYKFPIYAEKNKTILQGAFFYDIGGSWRTLDAIDMNLGVGAANLRSGVGFGIRFATPMFPLRLDWGYGLNHEPTTERKYEFYFTIGNMF